MRYSMWESPAPNIHTMHYKLDTVAQHTVGSGDLDQPSCIGLSNTVFGAVITRSLRIVPAKPIVATAGD